MLISCAICEVEFEAKRSTARFCSGTCRQRANTGSKVESSGKLVEAVVMELASANVLETYPGQLAVELARQMTTAGATGIASLSKELRTVMVAALEGVTPPASSEAESVDEVEKARQARERKTRNAAG